MLSRLDNRLHNIRIFNGIKKLVGKKIYYSKRRQKIYGMSRLDHCHVQWMFYWSVSFWWIVLSLNGSTKPIKYDTSHTKYNLKLRDHCVELLRKN